MFAVSYTRAALKALKQIDRQHARKIIEKIDAYAANPAAMANNVKTLKGTDQMRLRVDDYRVVFTVTFVTRADGRMDILKIGHRREIYE